MCLRALVALLAATGLLLAAPGAPGTRAPRVAAHAQLLSSVPGSGEVAATAPRQLRLAFTEPLEPRFADLELLDQFGGTIASAAGQVDPSDPRVLVADIAPLPDGIYSLRWRVVSAADGHTTSGSLPFGVGEVDRSLLGHPTGHGEDGHGHGVAGSPTESESRTASYLGFMLAFGLAIVGWAVVRPALGGLPVRLGYAQAGALLAGAFGSALLALGAAVSTDGGGGQPGADAFGYLVGSRTGLLLLLRCVVATAGALVVFVLARAARTPAAVTFAGLAGAVGLALTSAGGHAAAYASPAPWLAQTIHAASAGVWLAGLVVLVLLTGFGKGAQGRGARLALPRFSALALVSIGLVSATGLYAAWLQTGDLTAVNGEYSLVLALKVAIFIAAIVLGALNYLESARPFAAEERPFARRVLVEAGLAIAVVVVTSSLAAASPPALARPAVIAPLESAAGDRERLALGLQPGRPGPNRYLVTLPSRPPVDAAVALVLQRLDADEGGTRLPLRGIEPVEAPPNVPLVRTFVSDGAPLPPDSRWEASAVVTAPDGRQLARQSFTFALDRDGLSEGRALPPVDPGLVLAIVLLAVAVLGGSYALAGGALPRTNAATSRAALLGGSAVGAALALVVLVTGPRL